MHQKNPNYILHIFEHNNCLFKDQQMNTTKKRRIHFNGNVFFLSNANKIHPKIRCNKRNKHNELKRKRRRNDHLMEMKYQQKGIKLL